MKSALKNTERLYKLYGIEIRRGAMWWWWMHMRWIERRKKLFMDMRSCKKMTLFFSIARLLLWPLQDVLINTISEMWWKFFLLLQLSFFYYNKYIFSYIYVRLRNVDEEKKELRFNFMNLWLALWTKEGEVKKKLVNEIYFVRDFWDLQSRWIEIYTIMQINFYYQKHTHGWERKYVFKKTR